MRSAVGLVLSVLLVAGAIAPPAMAAGLSSATAKTAARKQASRSVERFGITYAPSMWTARCKRTAASSFRCSVVTDGNQCRGTLTVYRSGGQTKTKARKIGCQE